MIAIVTPIGESMRFVGSSADLLQRLARSGVVHEIRQRSRAGI
jgi:hypothetical protein